MYSRSFGTIEQEDKGNRGFALPQDYNGNLYRNTTQIPTEPAEKDKPMETERKPPAADPSKKPTAGSAIGFLERLTAEDILLFVFLLSLLKTDENENSSLLGLILALLLL